METFMQVVEFIRGMPLLVRIVIFIGLFIFSGWIFFPTSQSKQVQNITNIKPKKEVSISHHETLTKPLDVIINTIGNSNCDYTSLAIWEDYVDMDIKDTLFILVFIKDESTGHIEDDLKSVNRMFAHNRSNFLIVNESGEWLFWKIDNNPIVDNYNTKIFAPEANNYKDSIKKFIDKYYSRPAIFYRDIYNQTDKEINSSHNIIPNIIDAKDELIKFISNNPNNLSFINNDGLRQIIKALIESKGYKTEIYTMDDNYMIFYVDDNLTNSKLLMLAMIENQKLTINNIKQMAITVDKIGANKGIIINTSRLNPDKKVIPENLKYKIEIHGFESLQQWLEEYRLKLQG